MNMELYKEVLEEIKKANTVAIAGHVNPDGDCIGSICGLTMILEEMGKKVFPFSQLSGGHLSYIPGTDKLIKYNDESDFDLFIMVDLGDRARLGDLKDLPEKSKSSINFDHHQVNENICDLVLQVKEASSTCEIIADFAIKMGLPVTKDAATALYAGITTDSNRFLYDTARAACMRTSADLLDLGADAELVYFNEYQRLNPRFIAFQGQVIKNAEFLMSGKIAIANLNREMLKEFGISMPEAEGVVDSLRSLDGVEIAIIIKDIEENIQKLSFRSKEFFNVSELAAEFSGGGHIKASGATLNMSNKEAYNLLKNILLKIKPEELNLVDKSSNKNGDNK